MIAVDPRGLSATQWCNFMAPVLAPFGPLPAVREDAEWRGWADAVCAMSGISKRTPPLPEFFDQWSDWATRFIDVVR